MTPRAKITPNLLSVIQDKTIVDVRMARLDQQQISDGFFCEVGQVSLDVRKQLYQVPSLGIGQDLTFGGMFQNIFRPLVNPISTPLQSILLELETLLDFYVKIWTNLFFFNVETPCTPPFWARNILYITCSFYKGRPPAPQFY